MILLVLGIGFLIRLISLNQSLWLDEAINVLATQSYSLSGMITKYAVADFHPPGYFILIWIWTRIFGTSEIWVRIPSVVFGVITIYIVFLIGQKIYSKNLGLLAAFLLAINPLHIYYSQEARMYSLATLAVAINVYLFVKLIKEEKISLIYLIASSFLVLMTDYVAILIFPAQFVFLLVHRNNAVLTKWLKVISVSVLLSFLWIPTFITQLGIGLDTANKLPNWRMVVGAFDIKTIPLTLVKFIIGRISYSNKLIYGGIMVPIIGLFSLLLFKGIKIIPMVYRKLLIVWIVVPILLATLISFVVPIYEYFRVLYVLPAFVILTTLGIFSFRSKLRNLLLGIVIVIEVFSSAIYLTNPVYQREDWRGLVGFLNSQSKSSVTLFESSGTFSSFDYYSKGKINAMGALGNFPARDQNDLVNLSSIQGFENIYLVDYLVQISDPNRLVSKNLVGLGYRLTETRDFHGVGFVYHYVK